MNNPRFAILVLSCDSYEDMWEPFFTQFRKFWPECPFRVYLGSNTKKYKDTSVHTILSHTSDDWSSDLLKILSSINEKYIFLWMEDFLLANYADTELFIKTFCFMERSRALHIHMSPYIKPDYQSNDPLFGYYEKGIPYRINAPGFWNKRHLQKLLIAGENPWKFEIMGSYRASYYDGYYTMNIPLFEFIKVVEKGAITKEAYSYCKKNHIKLNLRYRRVNSFAQEVKSRVAKYIFYTITRIPWRFRVGLMDSLRKILISY